MTSDPRVPSELLKQYAGDLSQVPVNDCAAIARELLELRAQLAQAGKVVPVPDKLHPSTADLVARFAAALAEKLRAAEIKYGYTNYWLDDDWMDGCRKKLREHMEKGDPRDVAAYCAFLWHHGEATIKKEPKYEFPAAPESEGRKP